MVSGQHKIEAEEEYHQQKSKESGQCIAMVHVPREGTMVCIWSTEERPPQPQKPPQCLSLQVPTPQTPYY